MSQRLASSVQETSCGQKESLNKAEIGKKKIVCFWNRCSPHAVNVTSLILSKEREERVLLWCFYLSWPAPPLVKQCPAASLGEEKPSNERKQCSSPCVSLRKWCNATPRCTLQRCRRVLSLKMYNLAEFDTLEQPKNSIQKVVLEKGKSDTHLDPRVPVSVVWLSKVL